MRPFAAIMRKFKVRPNSGVLFLFKSAFIRLIRERSRRPIQFSKT